MARATTKKQPELQETSHRLRDVLGLCLVFGGIACLISLLRPMNAPIPKLLDSGLRLFVGEGCYVVAILIFASGVLLLNGMRRIPFSYSVIGFFLLFTAFIAERHIQVIPGARLDPALMVGAGGWFGGLLGYPLYLLLHRTLAYLLLGFVSLVGIVLIADRPIVEMVNIMHQRGRSVRNRLKEVELSRRAELAVPQEAVVTDRKLRPGRKAAVILDSLATETEPAKQDTDLEDRKLGNLFGITQPWSSGRSKRQPVDATPAPVTTPLANESVSVESEKATNSGDESTENLTEQRVDECAYQLPPLSILRESPVAKASRTSTELSENIRKIELTLEQFNIGANVVEVASGPSVTRYEVQLSPGIKVSKIVSLADNLAMSLAAIDVRVEAPIPGKSAIGLEVPNATPVLVSLRECLENEEYRKSSSLLTVALGKDVSGEFSYADITKMPHLLIGGSTNSGKSVCLNVLIASLIYRATPRQVKLMMIDPKRVELSLWDGIPHLMHPVVKDVKLAAGVFRAAIREMDRRYDLFASMGTRNIDGFNQKMPEVDKLPYIVLIVDELADLMMQQGPEIEASITRIAQLARATGIHLVIATQRPSVDIITGTIKANISSRIAFAVASQIDSRTILDMPGAERLVGKGDMLFKPIDASKPVRIQGCYLSEDETNALVTYLKEQERPSYTIALQEPASDSRTMSGSDDDVDDALMERAVRLVVQNGQASTSMLQRRFRIGYTRAARIVEMMEERGIVGPLNGAKPREILISRDEMESMFGGTTSSESDEGSQEEA